MKRIAVLLSILFWTLPAAAQVDPSLVGMWRLQWPGPEVLWQVRADGVYRLVGAGVRPNEHWGKVQASGGKWTSEWARGRDGGTYTLNGTSWAVTGALGPGTWQRIWPGGAASTAVCPDKIDVAAVERVFAGAVSGRVFGDTCEYTANRSGFIDKVQIKNNVNDLLTDSTRGFRAQCARGTGINPLVRCVKGLGDTAFFFQASVLYVYKGNRRISIHLETYPENAARHEADEIALARAALAAH